jgi:hypothetical protein
VVEVAAPASHGEAVRPRNRGHQNQEDRAVNQGRATGPAHDANNGVISMYRVAELASERSHRRLDEAEQARHSRRLGTLRRARRMELRAERRMVAAWRRAAELRDAVEPTEY